MSMNSRTRMSIMSMNSPSPLSIMSMNRGGHGLRGWHVTFVQKTKERADSVRLTAGLSDLTEL